MSKQHNYALTIEWTGNMGSGTQDYRTYRRDHTVKIEGKPEIELSSDPAFRGDRTKYNPEELLVTAISSCHMLWYLHFCSTADVIVTSYADNATGIMKENADGSGQFEEITLHPVIVVTEKSMIEKANELHHKANEFCFIARSCNFPIYHKPICNVLDA